VDVLCDVAKRRRVTVVLTVHQPKHGTFMRLTKVLLLHKGKIWYYIYIYIYVEIDR
jgi:ABC-type multidrug transport system ATPase subunit